MSQQTRNFSQDMPPPGGFGNVKIDYRVQKKGISNITFLALTTATIVLGLGKYIYSQKKEKSAAHSTAHSPGTAQLTGDAQWIAVYCRRYAWQLIEGADWLSVLCVQ